MGVRWSGLGMTYYYYIEDNGTNKYVWTKVTINASATKTFYIQKTGSYTPDPNNVFILFDDFDGTSIDTNKWNQYTSSGDTTYNVISVSGGFLTMISNHPSSGEGCQVIAKNTQYSDYIAEMKVRYLSWYNQWTMHRINTNTGADNPNGYFDVNQLSATKHMIAKYNSGWTEPAGVSYNLDTSIYYKSISTYNGNAQNFKLILPTDDSIVVDTSATYNTFSTGYYGFCVYGSATSPTNIYIDYLFLRQYITTEPTITVTDMTGYYKIEVLNNLASTITDYQIKIPNTTIGASSKTTSLYLTDSEPVSTSTQGLMAML